MDESKVTVVNDVDTVFTWESEKDSQPNKCRIRVFWLTWEKTLVIVTELADNQGRQIASATLELIRLVANLYDLTHRKMMWIEHYPATTAVDEDTYLQVILLKNEAVRYEMERQQIEALIGRTL